MKEYLKLFIIFFKIGMFTFGGGYAMLPMIEREIIQKHHMATEEEVLNYFAIGQCTPGVIAVNTATFIGYFSKGILGGIVATLGVISPSLIIITLIASVLTSFQSLSFVQHALSGIGVAVCALMTASIYKLLKSGIKDAITAVLFILGFILSYFTNISTIFLVVGFALTGIIINSIKNIKIVEKNGKE